MTATLPGGAVPRPVAHVGSCASPSRSSLPVLLGASTPKMRDGTSCELKGAVPASTPASEAAVNGSSPSPGSIAWYTPPPSGTDRERSLTLNQRSMRLLASPQGSRCASPLRGLVSQHPHNVQSECRATQQPATHVPLNERPRSVSPTHRGIESVAQKPNLAADGHSQSAAAAVSAQQLQMLREEMQMEHCNLVQAVRIMELLLRDEVCTCMQAVKKEAMLIEKYLENQLGLMRTELFGTVRDLRLELEGSGAVLQEKGEAALKPANSGRPVHAPAFTPLTEEPLEKRLASLDEAIEREVAVCAEMDRRLQKEMADFPRQLRMDVALVMDDSRSRALLNGRLPLQEPEEEARRVLSSGGWGKGSRDNFYSDAASDSKDLGFGRLQSLPWVQQQQQQRQKLLGTAAVVPAASIPAMTAPPPAVSLIPATGPALSVGLLREQEDHRRVDVVCEVVRHDALRDLLEHGSGSRGSPLRQHGDFRSRQ